MTEVISRKWLQASINLSDKTYSYEKNRKLNILAGKKYLGTSAPRVKNDFSSAQRYNGAMGNLKYSQDTAFRVPPTLLNEYNEEYESGRRTLVVDTTNRYDIDVSGYIFGNKSVKRHATSRDKGITIVGRY